MSGPDPSTAQGLISAEHSALAAPRPQPQLLLTPLAVADAAELAPVLADPRLYEHTGGAPPTLEQLRTRFERLEQRRSPDGRELWLNWTLRLRSSGEAIGYAQATVRSGNIATIAYVIGTPWRGRGHASEAARATVEMLRDAGVGAIRATIASSHVASRRVAARAGLRLTAELTPDGEEVWALPMG